MKKAIIRLWLGYIILSIVGICNVNAQQNHFIYIQADDKQAFSVSLNGKLINSSSIGYVIIPKLTDGRYDLSVTFPNTKYPEQKFSCIIDKADAGYALKNFKEKGWGLFNLQTLEITMAGVPLPDAKPDPVTANTNAFGDMLSEVVKDSSIKNVAVPVLVNDAAKNKQHDEKTDSSKLTLYDSLKTKNEPAANAANNNQPVLITAPALIPVLADGNKSAATNDSLSVNSQKEKQPVAANNGVTKILDESTGAGNDIIFVDAASALNDTIRIFIPRLLNEQTIQADTVIAAKIKVDTLAIASSAVVSAKAEADTAGSKILDTSALGGTGVNNPFFNDKKATEVAAGAVVPNIVADKNAEPVVSPKAGVKEECKSMFSDADLNKLRKKLFSTSGDDKMIATSLKYFQNKCVTADQLKTLSGSFLSDEARYNFFSAAFPYVYDVPAFASLENQLIDPLFKKRFMALLK